MKKKSIFPAVIALVLLGCIGLYFRPLSLSDAADQNARVTLVLNELTLRDGGLHAETTEYRDITAEQKQALFALLAQFPYRRTPGSLFSAGTLSNIGDRTLSIYLLEDASAVSSISLTASGKISVNGKSFRMPDAESCITRILAILAPAK